MFGLATMAHAASKDCNGVVKWDGNITNPHYMWRLDLNNNIVLCDPVPCDNPQQSCTREIEIPTPPSTTYNHNCYCPGIENTGTCSTNVQTNGPGGPITGVTCISNGCTLPKKCGVWVTGGPDPNGWFNVSCQCK